tara:strand:+ start:344 stop:571 length:228 start_codon:yes stop_codon:yes gene_type:complete
MKTYNEISKKLAKLTEHDHQKVQEIVKSLQNFAKKGIVSSGELKNLQNMQTSLNTFVEQYSDRVIKLLKQHHMLD